MYRAGILIISDTVFEGKREDLCADVIKEVLKDDFFFALEDVVPDEKEMIEKRLIEWSDKESLDLIVTSGGTGVSPRDVTPEATKQVIEKEVPGIAEVMRMEGYKKTPFAIISRAISGIRGKTLIINLPGSPKAVRESLSSILSSLPHLIDKMKGDMSFCGG